MTRVILESPYAGDVPRNEAYARACLRDSLLRGENPIASHLLYTQPGVLNDDLPEERDRGIAAGLAWLKVAEKSVIYQDFGISSGMKHGIKAAEQAGVPVEYRTIAFQYTPLEGPYLVHGAQRHIDGPFDLRVMQGGLDVNVCPSVVELWALFVNISEYLSGQEKKKP